jgi:MFS superfamily sulfate permease-like transporter
VSITARNGFGSCHCAGDGGSFRSSATSRGGIAVRDWLRGYRGEWLRPDIVAGLTTAAVVVPKAMAYATVAALPVEVGLYTAFVPMVIYAILGTSRPLSDSTTITLAILTGTQLALVVPGGDPTALLTASATLAVLVGIMLILASVLRG